MTAVMLKLKAPPRVCMKNTAQGECQVVNTARGETECCIFINTSIGGALNGILCLNTVK